MLFFSSSRRAVQVADCNERVRDGAGCRESSRPHLHLEAANSSQQVQKQPDPGRASFLSHAKCACYSAGGPNFRGAPGVGSQQPGQHSAHHRRGGRRRHERSLSLSSNLLSLFAPRDATPRTLPSTRTPACHARLSPDAPLCPRPCLFAAAAIPACGCPEKPPHARAARARRPVRRNAHSYCGGVKEVSRAAGGAAAADEASALSASPPSPPDAEVSVAEGGGAPPPSGAGGCGAPPSAPPGGAAPYAPPP